MDRIFPAELSKLKLAFISNISCDNEKTAEKISNDFEQILDMFVEYKMVFEDYKFGCRRIYHLERLSKVSACMSRRVLGLPYKTVSKTINPIQTNRIISAKMSTMCPTRKVGKQINFCLLNLHSKRSYDKCYIFFIIRVICVIGGLKLLKIGMNLGTQKLMY